MSMDLGLTAVDCRARDRTELLYHPLMRILLLCGVMAAVTHAQTFTTLVSFSQPDANPNVLIQGADGNFYGTTSVDMTGGGVLFKVTAAGALTTLYTFSAPLSLNALLQGSDGNFYGTGGGNLNAIVKITPAGTLTTLHTFCGQQPTCSDGSDPSNSRRRRKSLWDDRVRGRDVERNGVQNHHGRYADDLIRLQWHN
jgi:uncharacterized repeat protein (TIGR03803 family)